MIFATEVAGPGGSGGGMLEAFDFLSIDDAARHCIELAQSGYAIHKVVLPNGTSIEGERVESAITSGLNSVRVAISRLRA